MINSIEPQRPPKQSTQNALESTLRKQPAKQPAARRREQAKHGPAAVKPTHGVRKRINNTSKASTEQHKCSDIRSFWCKKPKEEQPKAAATSTADGKEQHAKKARTHGDTALSLELPSLKTLCWNVMGLTTVQDELVRIVDEHKQDVIVLAETKMRRQRKTNQRLAEALPEYQLYTSCKPDPENPRPEERWAAGVAVAVHKSLTRHASATHQLLNNPAASGHCQWVTLQPAGSDTLNLWAVYMPHDMELRKQVYKVLRDNVSTNNATLMVGDWNAAHIAADRASGRLNTADTAHQQLLADLQLCSTDDATLCQQRKYLLFKGKCGPAQQDRRSGHQHGPEDRVLKITTDDSDHYPILSDIPLDAINFQRPGPELPAPDRTATTKCQLKNYKLGTELKIGMAARQLAAELEEVTQQADAAVKDVVEADRPSCSSRDRLKVRGLGEEQVTHCASMMADMMSKAVEVAHETCEYTKGGPVPKRRYLKRQHAKACNCLDEYRACLTQAIAAYNRRKHPETDEWLEDVVQSIDAQKACMPRRHRQQLPDVPTCTEEMEWQRWTVECAKKKVQAKEECKKLKAEHSKNVERAKVSKFRKGYWQRQKHCNKQILGKSSKQSLQAIQDPDTQEIHTDPVKLQECVQKFFQTMANPTGSNGKTGQFMPAEVPREYPWQCGLDKGMDGLDLETKVGSVAGTIDSNARQKATVTQNKANINASTLRTFYNRYIEKSSTQVRCHGCIACCSAKCVEAFGIIHVDLIHFL